MGCLSKSIRQRSISSSGRCLNRSGIALHATGDCARSPIAAVLCLLLNCDTYPHTHPHNCGVRARLAAHLWRSWSLRAHARDHATSRPGLLSQRRTVRRSERRCGRDGKSGSGLSTRESGLRRAACDEVVRIRLDSWREACTDRTRRARMHVDALRDAAHSDRAREIAGAGRQGIQLHLFGFVPLDTALHVHLQRGCCVITTANYADAHRIALHRWRLSL